jgi:hypothetical protein
MSFGIVGPAGWSWTRLIEIIPERVVLSDIVCQSVPPRWWGGSRTGFREKVTVGRSIAWFQTLLGGTLTNECPGSRLNWD